MLTVLLITPQPKKLLQRIPITRPDLLPQISNISGLPRPVEEGPYKVSYTNRSDAAYEILDAGPFRRQTHDEVDTLEGARTKISAGVEYSALVIDLNKSDITLEDVRGFMADMPKIVVLPSHVTARPAHFPTNVYFVYHQSAKSHGKAGNITYQLDRVLKKIEHEITPVDYEFGEWCAQFKGASVHDVTYRGHSLKYQANETGTGHAMPGMMSHALELMACLIRKEARNAHEGLSLRFQDSVQEYALRTNDPTLNAMAPEYSELGFFNLMQILMREVKGIAGPDSILHLRDSRNADTGDYVLTRGKQIENASKPKRLSM